MDEDFTFILLYASAAIQCGFNNFIKEKVVEYTNDTAIHTLYDINTNPFNFKCEQTRCLAINLRMLNDQDHVMEEGWMNLWGLFTDFNPILMDFMKKNLKRCLPEVDKKLVSYSKCEKFPTAFSLISKCVGVSEDDTRKIQAYKNKLTKNNDWKQNDENLAPFAF